jgi:hypothetical protein
MQVMLFRGTVRGIGYGVALLYALVVLIVSAISSAIIAIKMRRKIRKDLGRNASDSDLADINTWIEVDKAEEKLKDGPIDRRGN